MATKHRLRFSVNDDILLLREVVSNNPFQDDTKWQVIINNLNEMTKRKFKHRTVKEHVQHLLKLFQQEDRKNLRKSSSEEQYAEKESLLQEVFNLMNKLVEKKICTIDGSNKTQDVKEEENYAETNLEDPLVIYINTDTEAATHLQTEILTPDSEESTAQYAMSKRAKKQDLQNSAFEYLKIRSEEHILLEKQKLELEQKKYELDQERFKLEVEERKRRLEMEIKEREEAIKDKQHNRRLLDELLNIIVSEKLKKN